MAGSKPRLPRLERMVSLIKERKVTTFHELCDRLDLSPERTKNLILKARALNYAVDIAGEHVGIKPTLPSDEITNVRVSPVRDRGKFAVISDLHFGSKYHLRKQLEEFVGTAYENGVRNILGPGDNLDGCYRHGKWELTHHGFQEQVAEFRLGLPQHQGLRYWMITGNHDQTFENESGMVVHEATQEHFRANGRRDLTMLGARGAYLRFHADRGRGVFIHLWHPLKGPAYALTYGLQKQIEKYAPGQKPDFVFAGHWHQGVYIPALRGVHAFSCGTFQGGGSSFAKSLGGAPTIGGWNVSYGVTSEGTVREVDAKFTSYFENEEPREVRLG